MPSFHAGWSVLLGIVVFRASRGWPLRAFAVVIPAAMVVAVVVTANHFVLDVFAGTAIVLATLLVVDHRNRAREAPTLAAHEGLTDIASPSARRRRGMRPFVVAHRAGNDLDRLRRAQELGLGVVEADLHLYAGRIEVRHLKTLGPSRAVGPLDAGHPVGAAAAPRPAPGRGAPGYRADARPQGP